MSKKDHQIVVFVADWCPHCTHMVDHVWTDTDFKQAVGLYHNSEPAFITCTKPQNRYLVQEFDLDRYPTVVIMDEDRTIRKRANNMGPDELVEFLENFDEN